MSYYTGKSSVQRPKKVFAHKSVGSIFPAIICALIIAFWRAITSAKGQQKEALLVAFGA